MITGARLINARRVKRQQDKRAREIAEMTAPRPPMTTIEDTRADPEFLGWLYDNQDRPITAYLEWKLGLDS